MTKFNFIHKSLLVFIILNGLVMQSLQAGEKKNIVVYGASGRIGQVIVEEALERGHKVTGVSRNPGKLQFEHNNFTAVFGDLMDVNSIINTVKGADAIVISVSARAPDKRPENSLLVKVTKNIHEALNQLENKPYIMQIGGANLMYGSTYAEVRKNMLDAPFAFEEGTDMYAVLFGHQISLEIYQANKLSWTILAPPMKVLGIYGKLDKTTTKGAYRTSTSAALVDRDGKKTIYVRDLARAAVSEIENREFDRQVFTVGY